MSFYATLGHISSVMLQKLINTRFCDINKQNKSNSWQFLAKCKNSRQQLKFAIFVNTATATKNLQLYSF